MAKTARDYPLSFPYGATSAPYSETNPHKGNDYETPMNTPLVIEGVTVGYTGNSGSYKGKTYSPHLHIQAGRSFYAQDPINPSAHEFKPGTVVSVSESPQWGKRVIIKNTDGVYVVYAHLNKMSVGVGQVIKKERAMYYGHDAKFWYKKTQEALRWNENNKRYYEAAKKTIEQQKAVIADLGARPTKADYQAALNKITELAEVAESLPQPQQIEVELGEDTRGWVMKILDKIF